MRKIKVSMVASKLKHVFDKPFIFSTPQISFLLLVIAANFLSLRTDVDGTRGISSLFDLASAFLLLPVIVNTHRYMLTGELPALRFGGVEARYFFAGIIVYIPLILYVFASVFAIGTLAGPVEEYAELTALHIGLLSAAFVGGLFVMFSFVVPMSLVLPARALGRNDFTYGEAMAAARHNLVRLALLTLMLFVIALGFSVALDWLMTPLPLVTDSLFAQLIFAILAGVADFIVTILAAGLMSLIYAGLVEGVELFLD